MPRTSTGGWVTTTTAATTRVSSRAAQGAEQLAGGHLEEGDEEEGTQDGADGLLQTGNGSGDEPPEQTPRCHRHGVDHDLVVPSHFAEI